MKDYLTKKCAGSRTREKINPVDSGSRLRIRNTVVRNNLTLSMPKPVSYHVQCTNTGNSFLDTVDTFLIVTVKCGVVTGTNTVRIPYINKTNRY
jgi:hypothetical protein